MSDEEKRITDEEKKIFGYLRHGRDRLGRRAPHEPAQRTPRRWGLSHLPRGQGWATGSVRRLGLERHGLSGIL